MLNWQDAFAEVFNGAQPYGNFQIEPARWLLEHGRNVILQAPTGAGKTMTAEFPFLVARSRNLSFPSKMIYSVPMRVLANQFYDGFSAAAAQRGGLTSNVQTGERPNDRKFASHAVFTTIDQTLSNFLNVPYALGHRTANMNAGAVVSGYLVFDEFHLFPSNGALKTTLQMLRILKGVTPFLLMTATFSTAMLNDLKELLDAEIVTVSRDELANIPTQRNKERRFHAVDAELTAGAVRDHHQAQKQDFKRTLAVCNTVERAQNLYLALRETFDEREVILLHSRFTQPDRQFKEQRVRAEFGKDKDQWQARNLIVVATQVIEVGLDITSWALHTEVAPANAVLQRAGRCARFENEAGEVYVYQAPWNNKREQRNYAPYHQDGQVELCEATWQAFAKPDRNGQVLDFHDEQDIINEVHHESDLRVLENVRGQQAETQNLIERAVVLGDTSVRRDLIRQMDSYTLLVHDNPDSLSNPLACQGFSIFKGSLKGKFNQLRDLADERETWAMMLPVELSDDDETRNSRSPLRYEWKPLKIKEELDSSVVFVVNPELVTYNDRVGLRFEATGTSYRTPQPARADQQGLGSYGYSLETYPQHITRMMRVFQRVSAEELSYPALRLEQALQWPPGSVERSLRLAIALHDVGKLEKRWQKWVREYQQAIGEPIIESTTMIVHTHNDPANPLHKQAEKSVHTQRPHHAGEGALASAKIVHAALQGNEGLRRAVLTAIASHHSPHTSESQEFCLHPAAQTAIDAALREVWVDDWFPTAADLLEQKSATSLEKYLLATGNDWRWFLAYFLIVRALRLADGLSQEEKS